MAQLRDAYHLAAANYTLKPVTLTTSDANGTGIDLSGYRGALMTAYVGAVGALQDGTNKCVIGFFESSDNSTFTAIADTDLIGGNNTETIDANAEANNVVTRAYIGTKRYVNIQFDVSGTISLPVCASIVRLWPLRS
jgi:hypothetical protein